MKMHETSIDNLNVASKREKIVENSIQEQKEKGMTMGDHGKSVIPEITDTTRGMGKYKEHGNIMLVIAPVIYCRITRKHQKFTAESVIIVTT